MQWAARTGTNKQTIMNMQLTNASRKHEGKRRREMMAGVRKTGTAMMEAIVTVTTKNTLEKI